MKNLFFAQKYWRFKILPNINYWSEILEVVHITIPGTPRQEREREIQLKEIGR